MALLAPLGAGAASVCRREPRWAWLRGALLFGALAGALWVGQARAQTPAQAGLVVVHGDGSVITRCVAFDEPDISGFDLLAKSGLDLHSEVSGMGPTVCRLDQEGCDAGQECFCRCLSSPCEYWSYWRWGDEGWSYSNLGAGGTRVVDGAVEGWIWGKGRMSEEEALQPPVIAFDEICTDSALPVAADMAAAEDAAVPAPDSQAELVAPVGLVVVLGVPLLAAGVWWIVRQARRQA